MTIFTYPMRDRDWRSIWPSHFSIPATQRGKWDAQQQFRGPYPWTPLEVEPDDDVRAEREERESRSRNYGGWRWHSDGTVRPEPAPQQRAAERAKTTVDDLVEKFGAPLVHRVMERMGMEAGPEASALEREAISIEEAAHAIQTRTVGVRVDEVFINKARSGQSSHNRLDKVEGNGWREKVIRVASIYLAGQVAQRVKYGKIVAPGHKVDNEQVEKFLLVAGNERDAVLAEAERYTEASLRARWNEVEAVAKALCERGTLSGAEFAAMLDKTTAVRKVQMPLQTRSLEVRSSSYDETAKTVDVIWSSGASVKRQGWDGVYYEVLAMEPTNVRLDWLNSGKAPFLNSHMSGDTADVFGAVVAGSAYVEGGRGYAKVKLSSRAPLEDIRSGLLKNVSVGYRVHRLEKQGEAADGNPILVVTDHEPIELSLVPVPADRNAEIRTFPAEVRG
jgi:hypothetical protein